MMSEEAMQDAKGSSHLHSLKTRAMMGPVTPYDTHSGVMGHLCIAGNQKLSN